MQRSGGEVLQLTKPVQPACLEHCPRAQRPIGPGHVSPHKGCVPTCIYQSSPALDWGLPKTSLAIPLSWYSQPLHKALNKLGCQCRGDSARGGPFSPGPFLGLSCPFPVAWLRLQSPA